MHFAVGVDHQVIGGKVGVARRLFPGKTQKDRKYWGLPENQEFDDDINIIDESGVPVGKVLMAEGDSMVYVYDFGDDWRHQIVLEKIRASDAVAKPVCLAGERRCPPEDVGGPSGFASTPLFSVGRGCRLRISLQWPFRGDYGANCPSPSNIR